MGAGCSSEKSGSMVQLNRDNIPNYKVVLIGDPGVGKTNVLLRYSKRQFDYSYRPTQKVTISHVVEKINIPQNLVVSLTIWDIPGSEDMDLRTTYYRNVDAVIAIVDMSDPQSIDLAGIWRQDFIAKATKTKETTETLPNGIQTTHVENVKEFDPRSVPVLLMGTKYDLIEEKLQREKMKESLDPNNTDEMVIPTEGFVDETLDTSEENSETKREPEAEVENRPITSNDTSSENEKLPECVTVLEELEEKHQFIASVLVSAKDNDGSVDAAMKSLVRYLLDKSKFIQPKKSKEKKEIMVAKKRKPKIDDYKNLATVGLQEYDTIFARCDVPVKRSGDYDSYYDLCLKKVKQLCADQGFITESGSSLEDCIVALKGAVNEAFGKDLEVEDDGDFVRLTFSLNPKDDEDKIKMKQNRALLALFDNFHSEYAAVCKAILRDGPNITAVLEKLDGKVEHNMECLESRIREIVTKDTSEGKPMDEKVYREKLEVTKATCVRNRARIAHAQKQIQDLMVKVENAAKKIKASLIW